MNIKKYLEKEYDRIETELKQLEDLKAVAVAFPDLIVEENRWRRQFYCSPSVNAQATDAHFYHACGCCNDAPLLVNAFINYDGLKISTYPKEICIGEKSPYGDFSDRLYEDWEDRLRSSNISQTIIDKVKKEYVKKDNSNEEESESLE